MKERTRYEDEEPKNRFSNPVSPTTVQPRSKCPVVNLSTGLLADYDSDGLFGVFEDWNSNGSYDSASGETDWQTYNSKYGIGPGPGLIVFTPLK